MAPLALTGPAADGATTAPVAVTNSSDQARGGQCEDEEDRPITAPVAVFHADLAGGGTSTALTRAVERLSGEMFYEIVWCDLEAIATVDGLMTYLQNRFRRFDPDMPPFAFLQTQQTGLSALCADGTDPRVGYIVRALQRGRYILAIDSTGEFGTSFRAYAGERAAGEPEWITEQVGQLCQLLRALIHRRAEFGESRLFIAHTSPHTGDAPTDAAARAGGLEFVRELESLDNPRVQVRRMENENPPVPQGLVDQIQKVFCDSQPVLQGCESISAAVGALWSHLPDTDDRKWALALTACFRRRRDLVALRRLLFLVRFPLDGKKPAGLPELFKVVARFGISGWRRGVGYAERDDIDHFLEGLRPLLTRQEGGFFWMHRAVRDEIYRILRENLDVGPRGLANAHDLIATYYYTDLFRPSNDTAALFEYVFHRLLSLSCADEMDQVHRLHDLTTVLGRERDHLLRDAHLGSLQRCIGRCRDIALPRGVGDPETDLGRARAGLLRALCELEAEACRQASLFDACIDIRCRQIIDRLSELFRLCRQEQPEATIRELGHQLATGRPYEAFIKVLGLVFPALERALRAHPDAEAKQFDPPLRLFDHVVEIAACRFALATKPEEEVEARGLLQTVGQVLDALRNALPDQLPEPMVELLRTLGKCPREVVSQIHDTRVRCAFRLMEVNLGAISPWPTEIGNDTPGSADKPHLDEAIQEFEVGQRVLQEYTGWQDRQYDHYVCFLNTYRARAAYLNRQYALAYHFLDAARAAIRRPSRGSDFSTLAVIVLHQAECLMLHADDELAKASKSPAGESDYRSAQASGKAKLDRARTALGQAHTFLERGRPQVWAWAWLRVLEAQLIHELIVWSFDGASRDEATRDDEVFRRGLTAIRLGLDCAGPSKRRKTELTILWLQFCVCLKVRLDSSGQDPRPESERRVDVHSPERAVVPTAEDPLALLTVWNRLNDETGLDGFLKEGMSFVEEVKDMATAEPTRKAIVQLERELLRRPGMPLSSEAGTIADTPAPSEREDPGAAADRPVPASDRRD